MSTKFILPYRPLQINIQANIPGLDYEEVYPAVELREYIYCYWFLNTKQVLSQDFEYRVLADGCVDIFLDIERSDEVTVMGFSNSYSLFPI